MGNSKGKLQMKNVVVMTAVKVPGMEARSIPYKYGIASFKKMV